MTQGRAPIRFQNVSRAFGSVVALDDFCLDVKAGEFVTLLGPSGSGKTTALNIVAGFDRATSGEVFIGERAVGALPPERRNVGMVFQSFALFPHMSVFENVAFPLRMRKVAAYEVRARVERTLEMVQLGGYAGRRPGALSGGQRQRVALARAVVAEPPVLLMDESLSALDLKLREDLQEEVRRLHRTLGTTIIFVTHDQGEALVLSDRIALMNHGRLCQLDTPTTLYDRPASRFVADFIGRTNIVPIDAGDHAAAIGLSNAPDGAVALSLRPEKLRRQPPAFGGGFEAIVQDVTFKGAATEFRLQTASGLSLRMSEARATALALPEIGQTVRLNVVPEDATPLYE
ncbi:ATP-binding cassette domain-containing protein [Chelativorans sp. ZYF759]|uniref:ABC transporter ATP-binding protein n=1 Tax=Chelativorans sp. ZYF759 TaxID=2692213 RepID=UPI00145DAED8|nr:ABC transporter ATP-binding protein [Chelativorans sp. ZYF759]NMG39714.1 ATP-binding cassette domain-containing protein [Chelativorans sp. ZYF759]